MKTELLLNSVEKSSCSNDRLAHEINAVEY